MYGLTVDPDAMTAYAATAHLLSADLATAGTHGAAADPLLLAPLLGLIGTDFVAAYTAAHAGHLAAVGALSTVLASIGCTTTSSAAAYVATDRSRARGLLAAGEEMWT
ncbi:type VII secretion target [Nocardia sp. NPDC050406]|uniref:type VII secretion target n=1 Tax=Nocardia sp. NPDC050406 TaxID=3364318 RepID=UPI0037BB7751